MVQSHCNTLYCPAKPVKTKSPRHEHQRLRQQYVSSRLAQGFVHTVGSMSSHAWYPVRVAIKSHSYARVS
jgi:hypothetical protein